MPKVRTAKSAWSGKISTATGPLRLPSRTCGRAARWPPRAAPARRRRRRAASRGSMRTTKLPCLRACELVQVPAQGDQVVGRPRRSRRARAPPRPAASPPSPARAAGDPGPAGPWPAGRPGSRASARRWAAAPSVKRYFCGQLAPDEGVDRRVLGRRRPAPAAGPGPRPRDRCAGGRAPPGRPRPTAARGVDRQHPLERLARGRVVLAVDLVLGPQQQGARRGAGSGAGRRRGRRSSPCDRRRRRRAPARRAGRRRPPAWPGPAEPLGRQAVVVLVERQLPAAR